MVMKLACHINAIKRDLLRQGLLYKLALREWQADFHFQKNCLDSRIVFHATAGYSYSGQSTRIGTSESNGHTDGWEFKAGLSVFPLKELEVHASAFKILTEQPSGKCKQNDYANAGVRWIRPAYEIELAFCNLTNENTYSVRRTVLSDTFYWQYSLRPREGLLTFRYKF